MEEWLRGKGLSVGENGVRRFGFDCHKGRSIPAGCRIYHVFYSVPDDVSGDSDIEIIDFPGGNYAKLIVTDPFSGDFPRGWCVLLKWASDNNVENRLGCASPDDIYSLFSNEEAPCLEELYSDRGIQHMALYLPT